MVRLSLLLLLSITFSVAGFAQIIIDEDDIHDNNGEYIYSIGQQNGINGRLGQNGANQVWDFSDLVPTDQGLYQFRPSYFTIYAFYFFGLNIMAAKQDDLNFGLFQLTNVYNFQKKSSSELKSIGLGISFMGIPAPAYNTDDDEIYQFPLEYGDNDQTTFSFGTEFPGLAEFTRTGTRENDVDGWGTIITPFDTFECIRVVTDIDQEDVFTILDSIPIPLPTATRSYKWLAKDTKVPVLEVSGNVFFGNFFLNQVKYIDSARITRVDFEASNTEPLTSEIVSLANLSINPANSSPNFTWSITPTTVQYANGSWKYDKDIFVFFKDALPYTIKLISENSLGTYDTTKVAYINPKYPVGVEVVDEAVDFKLYPTIVSNNLIISNEKHDIGEISFYNSAGQQVFNYQELEPKKQLTINMENLHLSNGNYIVEITTKSGITTNGKFIYQR